MAFSAARRCSQRAFDRARPDLGIAGSSKGSCTGSFWGGGNVRSLLRDAYPRARTAPVAEPEEKPIHDIGRPTPDSNVDRASRTSVDDVGHPPPRASPDRYCGDAWLNLGSQPAHFGHPATSTAYRKRGTQPRGVRAMVWVKCQAKNRYVDYRPATRLRKSVPCTRQGATPSRAPRASCGHARRIVPRLCCSRSSVTSRWRHERAAACFPRARKSPCLSRNAPCTPRRLAGALAEM